MEIMIDLKKNFLITKNFKIKMKKGIIHRKIVILQFKTNQKISCVIN